MTKTFMFDFSSFMINVLACNKSIHLLVEKICCFDNSTACTVVKMTFTIVIIVVFIRIPCEGTRE